MVSAFAQQFIIVILAALIQTTEVLDIGGVKPNLILIALVFLALVVRQWPAYLFLALTGVMLTKSVPGMEWPDALLLIIAVASYLLRSLLPWQPLFAAVVFLGAGTILLSLPNILLAELIYNIVLGVTVYAFLAKLYK